MSDRRAQWTRFYEAALTGSAGQGKCASMGEQDANVVTGNATRIADAAMARLDARDFPPTKVEALVAAAEWACRDTANRAMGEVRKALADLKVPS